MQRYINLKDALTSRLMRLFVILVVAVGAVSFASLSQGATTTANCLDGGRYQSYTVSYSNRNTGTLRTVNGAPLCKDSAMIFQSFNLAKTWDGRTLASTLPQTVHSYTKFEFPGGKKNHAMTVKVDTPNECNPTQIDFYTGSKVIPKLDRSYMGGDREVRSGKIFKATKTDCDPVSICVSLSRIQKDRDTWTFRGKAYEKNGAKLQGFTFNYGDGTSKYVAYTGHSSDTGNYKYVDSTKDYAKAGTYTVKITARFTINGKTVNKTSADCQKPVTVEPKPEPKKVKVCDLKDKTVKTITEDEYNKNRDRYTKDLDKCKEAPKPPKVAECVDLEASRIGDNRYRFDAEANVENGATIASYTFTVRNVRSDLPGTDPIYLYQTVRTTSEQASLTHTFNNLKPGVTYQVSVSVATSEGAKTGPQCRTTFKTPEAPKMVKVCDLKDKTVKTITEAELKANPERYTTDLDRCKPVKVCDLKDMTVKTITEAERKANPGRYTTDLSKCAPKPPKVAECVDLTAERIGDNRYRFDAKANVENGATISSYDFTVRNVASQRVTTNQEQASLTRTFSNLQPGTTYTVEVAVNTSEGRKTGPQCVTTFKTPEAPKMVKVCDLKDKTVKTVTEAELKANPDRYTTDLSRCEPPKMIKVCDLDQMQVREVTEAELQANPERYTTDLSRCEPAPEMVEVCDLTDNTVKEVTRPELEANPTRYTTDLTQCDDVEVCNPETGEIITVKKSEQDKYAPVDSEDCKTQVCDPASGEIITVPKEDADQYAPVDADDCKEEEPVEVESVVTELPQTGLAHALSGLIGLGTLTTATYYYVTSRRS